MCAVAVFRAPLAGKDDRQRAQLYRCSTHEPTIGTAGRARLICVKGIRTRAPTIRPMDDLARLQAILLLRGAMLPARPDADALAALERCRSCNYKKLCNEWLAARPAAGAWTFCPNAHYIAVRRQQRLQFA